MTSRKHIKFYRLSTPKGEEVSLYSYMLCTEVKEGAH